MKKGRAWTIQRVKSVLQILFSKGEVVRQGSEGWLKDLVCKESSERYVEWDNGTIGYVHIVGLKFVEHPGNFAEVD